MCLSENSIPFISQLKSLIFAVHCDTYGALQTQIAFSKQCIIISQIRSLIQWIFFQDLQGALQTQIEFYHESILPFPLLSQLISIIFIITFWDLTSAWRIQQKCINALTNLLGIPVRFIYYLFNYQASIGRQLSVPHTCKYSTWMSAFNNIPLMTLTLPGTHNAHSYKFRNTVSIPYNMLRNQSLSIYQQLICGSRCLDIRLFVENRNQQNQLWCAHNKYITVRFTDIIHQVLRFVKQYSSEVVILRCKNERYWTNKPNNPVYRHQIMSDIETCDDAKMYCAPVHNNVFNMTLNELRTKKWNIIVFHQFEFGAYHLITSWNITCSSTAKQLISNIKNWIYNKIDCVTCVASVDDAHTITVHKREEILYLVNGQITAHMSWKYILFLFLTGFIGIGCDSELLNAEMLKRMDEKELLKLNVWDMDFLHPLLVKKIIDVNLKYCHE